jgi:quinol monooxygenase YgiN
MIPGGAGARAFRPEEVAVFALTRLRVREEDADELAAQCAALLEALAARPGFLHGELGRSADDPALWALLTRWDGVGSYRRGLSAAEVKIAGAPVWVHAVDEPSVYVEE